MRGDGFIPSRFNSLGGVDTIIDVPHNVGWFFSFFGERHPSFMSKPSDVDDFYFLNKSLVDRMEKYTNYDGPLHREGGPYGQCHEWTGYTLKKSGYGRIRVSQNGISRLMLAHRAAMVVNLTPIPKGMFARHTCDNKLCVNPNHIIIGTAKDNAWDAEERMKMYHPTSQFRADSITDKELCLKISSEYLSARAISKKYNVGFNQVLKIKHGKYWVDTEGKSSIKPAFGEGHYNRKLTESDVLYIRASSKSIYYLAKEFNVSYGCIKSIVTNQTWKHLL